MFTLSFLAASKLGARLPWGSSSSMAVDKTVAPVRQGPPNGSPVDLPMGNGVSDGLTKIEECIAESPLIDICGIERSSVAENVTKFMDIASEMMRNLGMPEFESMNAAERERIFQYYLPVYVWCEKQLDRHKKSGKSGPLVLGISAPQGCGKSTLCEQLEALFNHYGHNAASISIDDFYRTRQDQLRIAEEYQGNRLLEMRGNAGSHDVELGTETLKALQKATTKDSRVSLPRYDKSAFQGKGDRADASTWPQVQGPVEVVLFEGWMLGFSSVGKKAVSVDPDLGVVDGFLKGYKSAWDSFVDTWLVIRVADPQFSYKWRLQAEKRMRENGKPAMTDEEVAIFVDRFMPAYKCYLPGLYKKGPTTSKKGKLLVVEVDENRSPLKVQPKPIK